jgi:hypothetical protein
MHTCVHFRVGSSKSEFKDKDAWYRCFQDEARFAEALPDHDAMWNQSDYDDLVIQKGLRDAAIFRYMHLLE